MSEEEKNCISCKFCGCVVNIRNKNKGYIICSHCNRRTTYNENLKKEYEHQRYLRNILYYNRRSKQYYQKNKERIKTRQHKYYLEHLKQEHEKARISYIKNRKKRIKRNSKHIFEVRKEKVALLGGKCQICGYDKCIAALQVHHLNPKEKENSYEWKRKNFDMSKVILLCANCHAESHYKGIMERETYG